MGRESYNIDIPVLLIFFNRSEPLEKVFREIKKARPSKLYLHQDGARIGRNDEIEVEKCRRIVDDENIDWKCEVHRLYQPENLGCDPAEYIAQKWLFDHEEMGIVLEDDDVPSQSFFVFAKELLEKYRDDRRISIICGRNELGYSPNTSNSYLFTKTGSIWGWASWRRFFELEDPTYSWLDDPQKIDHIKEQISKPHFNSLISTAIAHRKSGKAYYETLYQAAQYLNDGYAIVPKYNMIQNIGVTEDSTHNVSDIRLLPKRVQRGLELSANEIEFPLKHPSEIKRDHYYEKRRVRSTAGRYYDRVEYICRILVYKGPGELYRKIKKTIKKRTTT